MTIYEIFWLFGIPAMLASWYHIFKNTFGFFKYSGKLPPNPRPQIIFQIAARKLTPYVQGSVDSIRRSCDEIDYHNFKIRLVVDDIETGIDDVETVLVPKDFTCKSKFKARALHYALRSLPNSKDVWVFHLDEDALVTPKGVSNMLKYIQRGGNPIANGPSVFPYRGNLLTFYAEAQRHWTFYWLMDQLRTETVHWLNGSNLLIRSDVEQAVGWDFINCYISEDARFGYEATKKLAKTWHNLFGWHGGLTIEAPPVTTKGLLKQRIRWFWGSFLNIRYVPRGRLPRRVYSMLVWMFGFVLTSFFFVIAIGFYYEPWFADRDLIHVFNLITLLWILRYQVGIFQNLRFYPAHPLKKVLLHIGIIPLAPIVEILGTLPTVLAFILRPRSFQITAKRN